MGQHHNGDLRMNGLPPGLPARGWYPKQRRSAASTEHLDRLHQGSCRAWETGTAKKTLTLPPNFQNAPPPKFFHKSPREALRRVTSLLRKGKEGFWHFQLYLIT